MPCSCVCDHRPGNKYVPRSDASDTEEYDRLMQSCLRSDYSGRSSQKCENSSMLDDQAWNALSSMRQKACRFITSETEESPIDSLPAQCQYSPDFGYGGTDAFITANDLIDYSPQSEFLKKMKQRCQLLCNNDNNFSSNLDESTRNDSYDCQMSNESPRMEENSYNSQACGRVRFSQQGMDGCDDEVLYENSSYDPHCSADEKLLDGLIDKTLPNNQSFKRPKSANKKSQHISRSKKPSKCRRRRKRKSSSPEKCESENQFEPTLKKPHENSCERCWRYASPARSPVNKPDQKYDPNFRRGHSCYDFEGGDAEVYDIRISPCKNLQPITSREKQPETPPTSTLEARQLSGSWQRTPDSERRSQSLGRQRSPAAPPQTITPTRSRSPEVQTCSTSRDRTPEPQPQTWHRSPEAQPQTFSSSKYQTPGPQPQSFSSSCYQSPDPQCQTYTLSPESPPQRSVSIWHKSPAPQPQTLPTACRQTPGPQSFSSKYYQSPDPQCQTYTLSPESPPQRSVSIWHKSPAPQPQTLPTTCRQTPGPQSFSSKYYHSPHPQCQTYTLSPESPPQRSVSIWHKSPAPQPQTHTNVRQKTPEPQPQAFSSACYQTPAPQSFSSTYYQSPDPQCQTYTLSPESPPQKSISIWRKSPRPQPQKPMWMKSSEAQPQSFSPTYQTPRPQPLSSSYHQSLDPRSQTYNPCQKSPDTSPQRSIPTWHKSPGPQAQTYTTVRQKTPEPQPQSLSTACRQTPGPQSFSSTYYQPPDPQCQTYTLSPESPPQRSISIWHKSPGPQPQTYNTMRQKTPEPELCSTYHQSPDSPPQKSISIWQRSPRPQPQIPVGTKSSEAVQGQVPQQRPQVQRSPSPATPRENDYCRQSMKSQSIPRPQFLPPPPPLTPQGTLYSEPVQRLMPGNCIPGDIHSTDMKRCSNGIDDLDVTEYKTIQSTTPRHLTPPRPCPISLGTIPEAVESCRCKTPKSEKSSPKTAKGKSPKSPARQGSSKRDSMGQSSSRPSPSRRSKSPNKSGSRISPKKTPSGGSPKKSSKSPNRSSRSGNGSTKKCKSKSPSPKPGSSKQEARTSPQKSPQKSPGTSAKKTRSLDEVSSRSPRTPGQRPQSSDPRREVSPRKEASVRSPDQYLGVDHQIRDCSCGPQDSLSRERNPGKHLICCHCNWEDLPTAYKPKPKPSRSVSDNKRPYKGFDGGALECPHRNAGSMPSDQPANGTVNSSFERDCRLLSELQNTPSFDSTFQGMSRIFPSPRKYFMFYMTKCKENKGDDDVEVLVEELTQACPSKTDSRTKDLTDKMKKIMECPSDSMALRFQKGVSDQCKIPQSSRVLYF